MYHLHKFIQLSRIEKRYALEATFYCVFFKLMIFLVPLKRYIRFLGKQNIYINKQPNCNDLNTINKISRAIYRSRKIIPWKSKCFTEAITAKIMLRKRKVESTLYLGVNKNETDIKAHAWLKCGDVWVIGRKGSTNFTVISTFT